MNWQRERESDNGRVTECSREKKKYSTSAPFSGDTCAAWLCLLPPVFFSLKLRLPQSVSILVASVPCEPFLPYSAQLQLEMQTNYVSSQGHSSAYSNIFNIADLHQHLSSVYSLAAAVGTWFEFIQTGQQTQPGLTIQHTEQWRMSEKECPGKVELYTQ